MKKFIKDILKDKAGNYSLREVIIALSFGLVITSWIAQIGFGVATPEYMFYAIISLIAAGCFGYSLERKPIAETKTETTETTNISATNDTNN